MLHRDIMVAENMCRIGASFLLRLSRLNDLNPPDDANAIQNAPTGRPRTVVSVFLEYKPRIMES